MKFQKFKELPRLQQLAIKSGGSFTFGIILGYILFPVILKHQIGKEMSLRNKTDMKEMWEKLPFPLELKVWIWNVTNPVEANRGEKPILKEVGPYVYDKWMEKVNLIENKEEDSIEYNMKFTFYFKPELSGGLTGEELVYTPHLLMVGTANFVALRKQAFLKIATKATNIIYDNPAHVFPLHRVSDMLFDGVKVNCSTTEFSAKGVCSAYKSVRSLEQYIPNWYKYSVFGNANRTNEKRYKVSRGIKNITDVGMVLEYDGKKVMDTWSGEHCNAINGTDATIFRPFVSAKDELWTFNPDICRSIAAVYEKKSSYKGIKALRYVVYFGDLKNEPQNQCFCSEVTGCPPKSMMDLSVCIDGVIILSHPHFFDADPELQSSFVGFNPTKEHHETFLDFEPISGTPLFAKKRFQVNVHTMNIPEIELFSKLRNTTFPIVWFEETLALNKTFINMLKYQLFYPKKAVGFIKWATILGGMAGGIYTFYLHRKEKKNTVTRLNATAPSSLGSRSNNSVGDTQNNIGITPLETDRPVNTQIPGVTTKY